MGPRVCHQAWQIGRLDDASWLQRCSLDDQDNHHCTSHQDLQSQSTQEVMMMKINMPNKSDVGRKEPKLVEPNCLCLVLLSHLCLGRGHPCSLCLCSSIPCCTAFRSSLVCTQQENAGRICHPCLWTKHRMTASLHRILMTYQADRRAELPISIAARISGLARVVQAKLNSYCCQRLKLSSRVYGESHHAIVTKAAYDNEFLDHRDSQIQGTRSQWGMSLRSL